MSRWSFFLVGLVGTAQILNTAGFLLLNKKSVDLKSVLVNWLLSFLLLFFILPRVYGKGASPVPCFVFYRVRFRLFALCCLLTYPFAISERFSLLILGFFSLSMGIFLQTVYGLSRRHIFKALNTGHNLEVLQLEKYLLYSTSETTRAQLDTDETLESFYKRGPPKPLPLLEIFNRWKRSEETDGSVFEEYGYDLGESLRIPNRPRLTPEMEDVEGAISVTSLLREFSPEQATHLFSLISYGERSRIRYSTFSETFRQISLERNNLYHAIKDCKRLLNHFHSFLLGVELFFFFALFFITVKFQHLFLNSFLYFTAMHVMLPGSISFLESFIFLLVSHPYDNGDRVYIKGQNMVVRRVGLFDTSFITWAGTYVIIQNTVISKVPIVNIRRSISQYWSITLNLSMNCTNEALLNLKKRLQWYVKEEKMLSGMVFAPDAIEDGNSIRVRLLVRKNSNFQNGFFTLTNYTKCLACIIRIVSEEGLYYKPPIMRTKITDSVIEEMLMSGNNIAQEVR